MNIEEIYQKFRSMGYNPDGLKLKEVVRFLQILEHNRPCFGRSPYIRCPYTECCFRTVCAGIVPDITCCLGGEA